MGTRIETWEDFIASADLHIHSKTPKNRKGDYYGQVITKFAALLKITATYSVPRLLVVAGDFFDSPNVPYKVVRLIMEMLIDANVKILVVPGQHDLRYHVSGLDNTPLGILSTSKLVTVLDPVNKVEINGVSFIGAGWDEEPLVKADVLVMHRMVTKKEELWPGQTNYSTAHAILRKYPWAKCIISGDNHLPHALRTKENRLQINCGSLVRSTKTQTDFEPRCWRVNASNWSTKSIKIPIEPAEQVFDFTKIIIEETKEENKKAAEAKMAAFIDTLPQTEKERPNYKNILQSVISQVKPKDSVKNIINETMERVS